MGDLALVFAEQARIEIAEAIDREPQPRRLTRIVGDLELAARRAEDRAHPRRRVDDSRDIRKAALLVADIVQRVEARGGVLDADGVVEVVASNEIIDLADTPAIFEARLQPAPATAVHRDRAAGFERAGLGLDVDDAGGAEAVLRRQRAGDQRHRVGEASLQRLAEDVDPLRQLHPVDTELQVPVVATDMKLTERILSDAGCLQQQLIGWRVVALRLGLNIGALQLVDGSAEAWLDFAAGQVECPGNDIEFQIDVRPDRGGGFGYAGRRACGKCWDRYRQA